MGSGGVAMPMAASPHGDGVVHGNGGGVARKSSKRGRGSGGQLRGPRAVAAKLGCVGEGGLEAADAVPRGDSGGRARESGGVVGRKRPTDWLWLSQTSMGGALKEEGVPLTSYDREATKCKRVASHTRFVGCRLRTFTRRGQRRQALGCGHGDEEGRQELDATKKMRQGQDGAFRLGLHKDNGGGEVWGTGQRRQLRGMHERCDGRAVT
jgi:hypothetical protein